VAQGYPPRRPPAEPGPSGRHGYPDDPADSGRGRYPGEPPAPGPAPGRHGYSPNPGEYPGEPADSGRRGYPGDPADPRQQGYPGGAPGAPGGGYPGGPPPAPRGGYPADPRNPGGQAGRDDRGYPPQQAYTDQRGYRGQPDQAYQQDERRPSRGDQAGRGRSRHAGPEDDEDALSWKGASIYPTGPGGRRLGPPSEQAGAGQAGPGRPGAGRPGEPSAARRPPAETARRPARPERAERGRSRPAKDPFADSDEDEMAPWRGASIYPTGPGGRRIRPPSAEAGAEPQGEQGEQAAGSGRGQRAAAARARKSRRRFFFIGGLVVIIVAVAVLGYFKKLPFQSGPATSGGNAYITTYQPGEFRSVPDACQMVTKATISQYLPGKVAQVSQNLGSSSQSQCTWTLDALPNFRVLTVNSQAYAPSLLKSGNGSATSVAVDAYNAELLGMRTPPKGSNEPQAQIGAAVGLGSAAFTALQEFNLNGAVSDEITVVARDRNAVIIVKMQGQESGNGFSPVPDTTLKAAALAAAQEAVAALR
jgi:hypothetical protein